MERKRIQNYAKARSLSNYAPIAGAAIDLFFGGAL
jgi:hypothetical protein